MTSKAHNLEDKPRTKDVLIEEQLNFNALLLSEQTLIGLQQNGFRVPSPIQLKAIPIGKCGFDLIIKSKSGTGKTAVFSIIALELINLKKPAVQVLILTPTREIAVQIQDVLRTIGLEYKDLKIESFIGGMPIEEDVKKLAKCHIAVGAPGRIKHLLDLEALKVAGIKLFVLDEVDKLVTSDIRIDINYIASKLPSAKQVIASSATYSNGVLTYLDNIMSSPTFVEPNTDTPILLGLKQYVSVVKSNPNVIHQLNIKNEELVRLISQITFSQCLIFTNYQTRAESISNTMNRKGWKSMYISAAQNQVERLKVIDMLKEGKCRILFSTDITARGIDVANIDLVINYDVPFEASTYLHRIGRAGRFGSHGICITIAAKGKELNSYQKILGAIGGVSIPQLSPEGNLPDNLWNTDSNSFELIQAVFDDSNQFKNTTEISNSIMDLKKQRSNFKQKKSDNLFDGDPSEKHKETNKKSTLESEIYTEIEKLQKVINPTLKNEEEMEPMTNVESLLNENKTKEESLRAKVATVDAMALLKDLAAGNKVPILDESEINASTSQLQCNEVFQDFSNSKKRKRTTTTLPNESEVPTKPHLDIAQAEKKHNSNQIMYKNLALLSATRLLCESYEINDIANDSTAALDSYLKDLKEIQFNEGIQSNMKENILKLIAEGDVDSLLTKPSTSENEIHTVDVEDEVPGTNIEDIFKLSFDYAIKSDKMHWLDALGDELQEKMCLQEKTIEEEPQSSFSEVPEYVEELPWRRKHRTYRRKKKKTFKDFTCKNKKDQGDVLFDQTVDAYTSQYIEESPNQMDSNYQTGLYSDYAYANNEHYTSCFDHYSKELTETLQTFHDVESFESWFLDWQWHVQGVRDYVQQNIYLQEMNKYTYSNYNKN